MRIFTVLLLVIIVFFGGMMYGSYEKEQYVYDIPKINKQTTEEEVMQVEPFHEEVETIEQGETINMGEDVPYVHRVAKFFENLFVSVYDISLRLMYTIADLFY